MIEKISDALQLVNKELGEVIHGKEEQIALIIASWVAGGHILLEDIPGTGKTLLVKSIAKVMGLDFKRVQFTPDLLPSDITGSTIYEQNTGSFKLRKGPVFTSIFLGDEINRATPRTQSALLECMGERQVTIDATTHELDPLFLVIATQNPIEQHGTFPLPEAQLDRFLIKTSLGIPAREFELMMLKKREKTDPFDNLRKIIARDDLEKIREYAKAIKINDEVYKYILDLVEATRNHSDLKYGGGPRASIALSNLARAVALYNGDEFVRPGVVHDIFPHVMSHRLHLNPDAKFAGKNVKDISARILSSVRAPIKD